MSCDIRKKILQEKRRRSRNLGGIDTYASRIGTGSCWSSEHSYVVKACSCVLLATLGEFSFRGSFQSTVKKLFINSLTPVNVTSFQPLRPRYTRGFLTRVSRLFGQSSLKQPVLVKTRAIQQCCFFPSVPEYIFTLRCSARRCRERMGVLNTHSLIQRN